MHARIVRMFTRATRVAGAVMMFALPVTTVSRSRSDANGRLYTLDCGYAEFKDFGLASDTGCSMPGSSFSTRGGFRAIAQGAALPRMTFGGHIAHGSNAFQRSRACTMSRANRGSDRSREKNGSYSARNG